MSHNPYCPAPAPLSVAIRRAAALSLSGLLATTSLGLQAQDDIETQDTMVVTGTALKVATPLVETPRPVSIV
ncbi:iron complex outermembrane recepter protein [Franzmannia pantelleriensis]|nr:iron complex outermembrane recepter protein [Halomonas pantelleriensis]